MFVRLFLSALLVFSGLFSVMGQDKGYVRTEVYKEKLNKKSIVVRSVKGKEGTKKGVSLRTNTVNDLDRPADIEVDVKVPAAGWYVLEVETAPEDLDVLKKEDKTGRLTLTAHFQNGDARLTKRTVYDTYGGGKQDLGKFEIKEKNQKLKIWLPTNLVLYTVSFKPYLPPVAPAEAEAYIPKVLPSQDRPRLWVNKESLPVVRGRLQSTEHQEAWKKTSEVALKPYAFDFDITKEIFYNEELETVIEQKAFYYLMTQDRKIGQEAVDLATQYLSVLEFGNVAHGDITRELGRAIYTGSLVYDWCYDLISTENKTALRHDLMRLVRDMEIGWPPFYGLESIINGHGNEAQICRDMLSWSLAIYDEDPEPYKYISYTILEQLVPMRKFEYQSPRHNQGVDYGGYRFGWEMHAVWLYYRMLGYSVFDDNIKNMTDYWLYLRTPDGKMLRDGDMFNVKYSASDEFYWKNPQTMLLCYAFSGNRLIKGEFLKQGGLPNNPVLYLLLNDPALKADHDLAQLPLTKDFGPILGSMVARTGWEESRSSANVVAEIKGGGYHFGNHQHADAGALQIYHHGIQVGDLGLYLSYGSPYDFNFNKRSASHSMMLIRDPKEPLLFRTKTNDGGTRFSQRFPKTPDEVLNDPWFYTGYVRSSAFGPDVLKPSYSYFNVDLTAAYSAKVAAYSKSFLFLNLEREDVPAVILLWDDIKGSDASFERYWQINTLNKPTFEAGDIVLHSSFAGKAGQTYVNMMKPNKENRTLQVLSGDSSAFVFGDMYRVNSPWPEAKGSRLLISPRDAAEENQFFTIFQMAEDGKAKLPEVFEDKGNYVYVRIADKIVIMTRPDRFLEQEIVIDVPTDKEYEIIVVGLKEGFWHVEQSNKEKSHNVSVLKDKNSISLKGKGGRLHLKPVRQYQASEARL